MVQFSFFLMRDDLIDTLVNICLPFMGLSSIFRNQRRMANHLKLELQTVMRHSVGYVNPIRVLLESSQCS